MGMMENLVANVKAIVSHNTIAAGTTDSDGTVIDMAQDAGYDGVMFVAHLDDVVATAVANLQVLSSAAANGSSPLLEADLLQTVAAGASDQDNKLLIIDFRGPVNRYVFLRIKRGTANVPVKSAVAYLYNPRSWPVVQGTDVIKSLYDWTISS